jgi:DNA-nicking Smr family endonuclease
MVSAGSGSLSRRASSSTRGARGALEMRALCSRGDQRHRDRGQAQAAPFHRRRDGAGVDHVVAEVGAVVDAGEDDVRIAVQHAGQRQVHAVGGRAGDAPGVLVAAQRAHRLVEGEEIGSAGTVAVRGDDGDPMAGGAQASDRWRMPGASTPSSLLTSTCIDPSLESWMITDAPRPACLRSSTVRLDCGMARKPEARAEPEDAELFREAIGEVRRIEAPPVAPAPPRPRHARAASSRTSRRHCASRDCGGEVPVEGDELLAWRRDHVSERTPAPAAPRRIRHPGRNRPAPPARARTPKHCSSNSSARPRAGSRQCVRIIHGKGLRSEGAPVLKMLVDRVLRLRGDVLAFASAPRHKAAQAPSWSSSTPASDVPQLGSTSVA